MPGAKAKSEVLSIRMPISTIIGCYDIHNLMDEPTINKAMSTIVSDALTTLIDVMRGEGKLPQYTDREALLERLNMLTGNVDKGSFAPPTLPDPAQDLVQESTPLIDENFVQLVDAVSLSATKDPIASGSVDIGSIEPGEIDKTPTTFADLLSAYPDDRLVVLCGGDKQKEQALADVYANIPEGLYGSKKAESLLDATLEIWNRHHSDDGASETPSANIQTDEEQT